MGILLLLVVVEQHMAAEDLERHLTTPMAGEPAAVKKAAARGRSVLALLRIPSRGVCMARLL